MSTIDRMMNAIIEKFGYEDMRTIVFNGLIEYEAEPQVIKETFELYMELEWD